MAPKILKAIQNFLNRGDKNGVDAIVDTPIVDEPTTTPTADPVEDPMGWLLESGMAEVMLMNTHEIKMMFMFGYALLHAYKLYPKLPERSAVSFRLISLMLACTGGGILVPILTNGIPVTLSDSYPIVIIAAFLVNEYYPIIREVIGLSPVLKVPLICMYECNRAFVVTKLVKAAASAIAPSEFDFPLFGPIFCGTIAGCGGAFLPMNKGLSPIQETGLQQPMMSAFIAATCFHLFYHTSLSDGVVNAHPKGQLAMAAFFIAHNIRATYFSGGAATNHVSADKKKN
mmetsp:Transcript_21523/g.27823  ORF Transcript_21523/g.27823 Transcript_21523/m.27823 type:complete len:286 (+) Transcript_21523:162-1019(+)|eukprot:CAMPEP_0198140036 /NCGR_PEP_ID=MMETSP1443-20131203/3260_1 /TAXON_ID=186043 /ORGANISM="Entomoneis sp., Strain CCMP2396" /LENGTH=285 /DNA_ID=CAMNT_0043802345 /DNA_START=107 /DNA_END=964 /DNA_ORIENTATION=-